MIPGFLTEQNSYDVLLQSFPPRPIKTNEQFLATQQVVDGLLDKGSLTVDEQDYLNLLGTLIENYESQVVEIPDISGVEMLKVLIDEFGLRQKDLVSIFKTESIVSDVINCKRSLTVEHIQGLAAFFHVSPAVFFKL